MRWKLSLMTIAQPHIINKVAMNPFKLSTKIFVTSHPLPRLTEAFVTGSTRTECPGPNAQTYITDHVAIGPPQSV